MIDTEIKADELLAIVNDGRWIVECPLCHSALAIKQFANKANFERFGCIECGYGFSAQAWDSLQRVSIKIRPSYLPRLANIMQVAIMFPDNLAEIEETLSRRKHAAWRNWKVGETKEMLIAAEAVLHFSWTAPRTWVVNEVVTASILNTHVRDDLLETAPAKVTTKGDLVIATAANALSRLAVGSNGQALIADSACNVGMKWGGAFQTNTIAYFNSASAPSGWTELTAARGRFILGLPSSGSLASTVGTALTNLQDKTHSHTSSAHTHDQNYDGTSQTDAGDNVGALSGANQYMFTRIAAGGSYGRVKTGVTSTTPGATGTAATSDVVAYIQYLAIIAS